MPTLTEEKGTIHFAKVDNSARLQRVLEVLLDHKPHTTLEIQTRAFCCAVSTNVCELRKNGYDIICHQLGRGRFEYTLMR